MALIIGQNDIKTTFLGEWTKYVTGILTYGEKSTKKDSTEVIRNVDNTGTYVWCALIRNDHGIIIIQTPCRYNCTLYSGHRVNS